MSDELKWWPVRAHWPTFAAETYRSPDGSEVAYRPYEDEALALLLLNGNLVPLNAAPKEKEGRCGLFVQCSDVFYPASSDAEPLPALGCGEDTDFWALYDLVREHGWPGAMRWCALRREIRPLKHWCDRLREVGLWDEKMEALP